MRLLNYLTSSWKTTVCIVLLAAGSFSLSAQESPTQPQAKAEAVSPFVSAQPIWPKGLVDDKNITIGYRTLFQRPAGNQATLKITGHSLYRIFLNGQFLGHGPARGPHDYYRGVL
jgi:hypothetical protein